MIYTSLQVAKIRSNPGYSKATILSVLYLCGASFLIDVAIK
ncbi:MAG: hypothetical protein QM220_08210 [Atribacterota bacterium]|nr:hypothetical protein [Atribacterota bacterium]